MRVNYMSDLHLEFGNGLKPLPKGDVLLLAGDILLQTALETPHFKSVLAEACDKHKHVFMIRGNHEPYHDNISTGLKTLRDWMGYSSLTVKVMECQTEIIDGVAFHFATHWTDMAAYSPVVRNQIRSGMNDFRFIECTDIGGIERRFRPEDAAQIHADTTDWLKGTIINNALLPTVVITHHAPSIQCNSGYRTNRVRDAYCNDLDALIITNPHIKYWVHGHTHEQHKPITIGATQVVANMRGYVGHDECQDFDINAHFSVGVSSNASNQPRRSGSERPAAKPRKVSGKSKKQPAGVASPA